LGEWFSGTLHTNVLKSLTERDLGLRRHDKERGGLGDIQDRVRGAWTKF